MGLVSKEVSATGAMSLLVQWPIGTRAVPAVGFVQGHEVLNETLRKDVSQH